MAGEAFESLDEPKRPVVHLPLTGGAFNSARAEFERAKKNRPDYVEENFVAIIEQDRELAAALAKLAYDATRELKTPDTIIIESLVIAFDAVHRTADARALEAEHGFDVTTAA